MSEDEIFTLQITRKAIASQDFTAFQNVKGHYDLSAVMLPALLNRVRIEIEAGHAPARILAADLEVRRYLGTLHRHYWPYAPWVCELADPFLTTLFLALADPIQFIEVDGQPGCEAVVRPEHRSTFLREGMSLIADLGQHAQLSPTLVFQRQIDFARRITCQL